MLLKPLSPRPSGQLSGGWLAGRLGDARGRQAEGRFLCFHGNRHGGGVSGSAAHTRFTDPSVPLRPCFCRKRRDTSVRLHPPCARPAGAPDGGGGSMPNLGSVEVCGRRVSRQTGPGYLPSPVSPVYTVYFFSCPAVAKGLCFPFVVLYTKVHCMNPIKAFILPDTYSAQPWLLSHLILLPCSGPRVLSRQ